MAVSRVRSLVPLVLAAGFIAAALLVPAPRAQAAGPLKVDTDQDGCLDVMETSIFPQQGGLRSHTNFWDFYDVPTGVFPALARNKAVSAPDFFAVLGRFGAEGTDTSVADALTAPPAAPAYHAAYDRGPAPMGGDPWDLNQADGSIAAPDFFANLAQFGHECTLAPNAPGMSLKGPSAPVPVSQAFTITINADPDPNFGIGAFQTEVTVSPSSGLTYIARPTCQDEAQVLEADAEPPDGCFRSTGSAGEVRHFIATSVSPPSLEPFDSPMGSLVEIDFTCDVAGTYQLTLTALPDASFGAAYVENANSDFVEVPTVPKGGMDVADALDVTCV